MSSSSTGFAQYRDLLADRAVRNLMIVGFFARFPHSAGGVLLTLHIVKMMGLTYTQAGIVATALTVGVGISGPWRGRRIDRRGLRKAMLPSVVVELLVWPLAGFVEYRYLILLAFIGGLFSLPIFTVMRQCLSVMVREEKRRAAFALDSIVVEVIFMIGPALGVILATAISTQVSLILLGVLAAGAGALIMWFNPPTRGDAPVRDDEVGHLTGHGHETGEDSVELLGTQREKAAVAAKFKERYGWITSAIAAVLVASVASGLVLSGTDVSIIAVLETSDQVGLISLVFLFWCGASIVGGVVYGSMNRPIHPLWLTLVMAVLTAVAYFAVGPWSLALLTIPAGLLCTPALSSASEAIAKMVPEAKRGEAMGWNGSAMTVGHALGAPGAGIFIDSYGAQTGFLASAAVATALVGGALLARVVLRARR